MIKQIRNVLRVVLCLSIVFTAPVSYADHYEDTGSATPVAPPVQNLASLRLLLETDIPDIDSTRFTVDFGQMSFAELGDLPTRLGEHADILPDPAKPLIVSVFVPATLSQTERDDFVRSVEDQMSRANPLMKINAVAVAIDTEKAELDKEDANARIDKTAAELVKQDGADLSHYAGALKQNNEQQAKELRNWDRGFRGKIAEYKNWLRSGYTKDNDKSVGGWIGSARGLASAAVWLGFNRLSVSAAFQIPASFFLDWFFSKYEREVDIFKGTHRIPLEQVPVIKHVVRFYNERPLLKSWIIGNLIGFVAGNYFRFWSWFEDPERTSAPWSADALATYGSAWSIGSLAGAVGSQGPRILRKKGYMSSRAEYYLYVSYGMMFQLGGWFYGLGWNHAVLAAVSAESTFKVGLYAYARVKPFKEARAIALHPALAEREVNEMLYRVGIEDKETTATTEKDFATIVGRLKAAQTVTWKKKVGDMASKAYNKCAVLLSSKKS